MCRRLECGRREGGDVRRKEGWGAHTICVVSGGPSDAE